MTQCKFFAHGICRNGDSCNFSHRMSASPGEDLTHVTPVLPVMAKWNHNSAAATYRNNEVRPAQMCRFFLHGKCSKGEGCRYIHHPAILPSDRVYPETILEARYVDQQSDKCPRSPPDSRATVPCRYFSSPRGCQNINCPYLHVADESIVKKSSTEDFEAIGKEEEEREDDFIQNLLGASVYFNEVGHILKVSFPADFSLACITGLAQGTNPEALVGILRGLGFDLTVDCVRISKSVMTSELKAIVKVEDPLFARELSSSLKNRRADLSVVPIPVNPKRAYCRKVYISWHRATRSVWVNFGSGEIANRVAQKFNAGRYKCLGQPVRSSLGKSSSSRGDRRRSSNPLAWTIALSNVPSDATSQDIEEAIEILHDKPRHVELGPISYQASDAEVSVIVRTHLEEHGPLESFYLAHTLKGRRVKAIALFADDADAKSACSLNNRPLDILGKGKLTVTIIHSASIKISTAVYVATKSQIDMTSLSWKERHLGFHVYTDIVQHFTTLKIEGSSAQDIAKARKTLDLILNGTILTAGDNVVWSSSLSRNGSAYKKLKSIEKALSILIVRVKIKRQLQYYGPAEKLQQAIHDVTSMLRDESPTNHGIPQQKDTASQTAEGNPAVECQSVLDIASLTGGNCPICLEDEPDSPIQTHCKHTYCLECFENCCKSAASTSRGEFQVECQGDGGNCAEVFTLVQLKGHLSSSAFETVLKSSFEEYFHRHPKDFHYCPTPNCGYVYRCTSASNSKPPAFVCLNCLEPVCTSCHAHHGDYTCAEYKDIASGGYEALEKLKKELNIKDCPNCKTLIEKTMGCNHMACEGCRAHICWVCMAVFGASKPCYAHMLDEHGSIGLPDPYHLIN